MKKGICMTLILIFLLCGCRNAPVEKYQNPVNFYYCRQEISYHSKDSVFCSEIRESNGSEGLSNLLWTYLKGPERADLVSPFPAGLRVVSVRKQGDTLCVELSRNFAALKGMDLTRACACLSLTLGELTDAKIIEIRTENVLLDGKDKITMLPDSLQLMDSGASISEITEEKE